MGGAHSLGLWGGYGGTGGLLSSQGWKMGPYLHTSTGVFPRPRVAGQLCALWLMKAVRKRHMLGMVETQRLWEAGPGCAELLSSGLGSLALRSVQQLLGRA